MPGFKKKKLTLEEQLDLIEPTFRDSLNGANLENLRMKYAEVKKDEEANQSAKKADEDLAQKKAAADAAAAGYSDLSKRNKLKTKYLIRLLSDSGDTVAQQIIMNTLAAEAMKG